MYNNNNNPFTGTRKCLLENDCELILSTGRFIIFRWAVAALCHSKLDTCCRPSISSRRHWASTGESSANISADSKCLTSSGPLFAAGLSQSSSHTEQHSTLCVCELQFPDWGAAVSSLSGPVSKRPLSGDTLKETLSVLMLRSEGGEDGGKREKGESVNHFDNSFQAEVLNQHRKLQPCFPLQKQAFVHLVHFPHH